MEDSHSGAMIKLAATNYSLWRPRMIYFLHCKDLFDFIELKRVKPESIKEYDWNKLNNRTLGQIRQWIGHNVFHHVAQDTDAYEMWRKLEDMFQAKTARNKALIMRRIVNLKLRSGTSVAEHTNEFQSLVNQLSAVDMQLGDEVQALLLLSSLPDSWETLVVTLSNSAPGGKVTMPMVKDSMSNEESRRKDVGSEQTEAFVTETRGRHQGRDGERGRSTSRVNPQIEGSLPISATIVAL